MRDQNGIPLGKVPKRAFKPNNPVEARKDIRNDTLTLFENDFNLTRQKKIKDQIEHKAKILHGDFMCSKAFDNAKGPDWTQKSHQDRLGGVMQDAGFKRNTLMNTGDKFITGGNRYEKQLTDFSETPRLSILNNYRRIKQIMNSNYVKGFTIEQKYRNRTKQDADDDPEWAKYKDEKKNSSRMSTILRSLNSTKQKKRTLAPNASSKNYSKGNHSPNPKQFQLTYNNINHG